ncbi:MAG TPA: hypothetical protein VGX25_33395 [Actinophytocola sp.]|uniref:hypothetical protein n=1 Tax=Actinophytocola sp. TaxID=1872138 RepID=UPI002DDDB2F0|nr:hypothetical protein [Actinophytocola sp.]HEV2784308.1 hypothetical protein [Actinophytocola sp.]
MDPEIQRQFEQTEAEYLARAGTITDELRAWERKLAEELVARLAEPHGNHGAAADLEDEDRRARADYYGEPDDDDPPPAPARAPSPRPAARRARRPVTDPDDEEDLSEHDWFD